MFADETGGVIEFLAIVTRFLGISVSPFVGGFLTTVLLFCSLTYFLSVLFSAIGFSSALHFTDADFTDVDLTGVDFSDVDCADVDFSDTDFSTDDDLSSNDRSSDDRSSDDKCPFGVALALFKPDRRKR